MPSVAPNIREFTPELVSNVLTYGKKGAIGRMPAMNMLNAKQKEAVGAYLRSLAKGE
jgi:cytochrome c oxidase cbb3-type subunit 3